MSLPIFFLILIIAITAGLFNLFRERKILLIISIIYLFIISTPLFPSLLIESLENDYPTVDFSDTSLKANGSNTHILVLGLSQIKDKNLPDIDNISSSQLGRIAEGIRLYKSIPGSKIVIIASEAKEINSGYFTMRNALSSLGIDSNDVYQMTNASTTYEEALTYSNKFGKIKNVFVVTEAISMSRTMNYFRKLGMNPIPAPTNFYNKPNGIMLRFGLLPGVENIQKCNDAIYEYIGLLWQYFGRV